MQMTGDQIARRNLHEPWRFLPCSAPSHTDSGYGKRSPGGGLIGLGTSPCRTRFCRLIFGSGIGTAASSASV